MRRTALPPRPDAAERHRALGFAFAAIDGEPYWEEEAVYRFTLDEIERELEAPTAELGALLLDLVDRVIGEERLLARLKIPRHAWDLVADSRRRGDPSLYGRFDLAYGGTGPAKLLEFNADTPTSLYEAAVVQWWRLQDGIARGTFAADTDQFNSLQEKLIAQMREVVPAGRLHFAAATESVEDTGTVAYLADCAVEAGLAAEILDIAAIGLTNDRFVDLVERPIETLFKLYPWEWLFAEEFGRSAAMRTTRFVEPPWKAILSNKGMLALAWDMAPGHPNLLPTFFDDDPRRGNLGGDHALKPLFSREGANVVLVEGGRLAARTGGTYGAEGGVVQALARLPVFDGKRPVIGSWLVGDEPAGMGIREDVGLITGDRARFVPHVIDG